MQTPILILVFAVMAVMLVGWWLMRKVEREIEIETRS
jgi:hypothetical protein